MLCVLLRIMVLPVADRSRHKLERVPMAVANVLFTANLIWRKPEPVPLACRKSLASCRPVQAQA